MPSTPSPFGCIYLITNTVNGKVYVGQTTKTLSQRWEGHKRAARGTRSQMLLHKALQKHGTEVFRIECLEHCPCRESLNAAEAKWIGTYNSNDLKIGYNCTTGGDAAFTFTPEVRAKISGSQKKRLRDPSVRANLSQRRRRYMEEHPEARGVIGAYNKTPQARVNKSRSRRAFFAAHPEVREVFREAQLDRQRTIRGAAPSDLVLAALSVGGHLIRDLVRTTRVSASSTREILHRYKVSSRPLLDGEYTEIVGRARSRTRVWFREGS